MIIVNMKNYTEKKKKVMFFTSQKRDFSGEECNFSGSIGRGVLRVRNKFF